MQHFDKNLLHL